VTTTTTTTTKIETIVKGMFESSIQKSTVILETVSISQNLISIYIKSEKWSEAIKASKKSFELIWRVVISRGGAVALPREFGSAAIDIAIRLAVCHQRSPFAVLVMAQPESP
jgi:hypothetical protein